MILAVKNEGAFIYNNLKEKEELLKEFASLEKQVFSDDDRELALDFSESKKIKGFKTKEMTNIEVISELKQGNTKIIKFFDAESKIKHVILNNMFILNTKKYLEYSFIGKKLIEKTFKGDISQAARNLEEQIKNYADIKGMSICSAAFDYLLSLRDIIEQSPYTEFSSEKIVTNKKTIFFENVYDGIITIKESPFKYNLYKCKGDSICNMFYDKNAISGIKTVPIDIEIKDKNILKAIRKIEKLA